MSFAALSEQTNNGFTDDVEVGNQNGVSSTLNHISLTMGQVTTYITNINRALEQLGTEYDTPEVRTSTCTCINNCQKLFDDLMNDLNHLDGLVMDATDKTSKDIIKAKFSKDILRSQISNVYNNYQPLVRSYNDRINSAIVKGNYEKQLLGRNKKAQQKQHDLLSSSDKTPLLSDNSEAQIQTQIQIQDPIQQQEIAESTLQYHTDLIQQRDEAITSISQGVQDINKIFKDLDELVNQQGGQIDSIENNMINYANNNQLASHELVKANNYQRKKGKWTCILLVILVIFLVICLALIS